jgi:hypothetical protein
MHRIALGLVCASVTLPALAYRAEPEGAGDAPLRRRMSFHNRLLLNRAMLARVRSIEVLLLVDIDSDASLQGYASGDSAVDTIGSAVSMLGGRVVTSEPEVGYLRIEIPPARLVELVASPAIEAYQISSFSRGSWYRDGPPLANARMFRDYEVTPIAPANPASDHSRLPELTAAEAQAPGFTADDDVGLGEWRVAHPTFDGRGVTIAILENALPSFADPAFRLAKTLQGEDVPKIRGILNAIPPGHDDETRVRLDTRIDAARSWARVGNRTYILPRPGPYRMGMLDVPAGANLVHHFATLEHETSREVWIDSNGDASFQDEQPLVDVNERFEPRFLTLTFPRRIDVSFVMSRARDPHAVHIYLGKSGHQTMTASVAAGNRTDESLASGVAPNARVLFVRINASGEELAAVVEGFIQAAQRDEVDVINSSAGLSIVPDTSGDLVGAVLTRITTVYQKPIVNAAGNFGLMLGHVQSHGGALSVGGTLGPATYAAFYGGSALAGLIVHPWSAAGPAIDGLIKPDILAPVERIAANPPWMRNLEALPASAPARRVPPGYEISCCTSASSPYAAGVIALLISAARQSNVAYSADTIKRALTTTARPIPGFQAHQQGNGRLDISAAWQELASGFEPPRIVATASVVHPLAQYAARGTQGGGILEFEGWVAGMKATREIRFRRESGPPQPVTYRLEWTADDGTFSTPPAVTLPLRTTVPLLVRVDVKRPGAHSGLLTLRDPTSGAIAFRTQATVVAAERVQPTNGSVRVAGTVAPMRQSAHYFDVPHGAGAIGFELEVSRGVVSTTVLQAHGLSSNYYTQVHPMDIFPVGPGTFHLLMPNPEPGTWTVRLKNTSMHFPAKLGLGPRDDQEASYALRMRVLNASIDARPVWNGAVDLELANAGSPIAEPTIEAWAGRMKTHRASFGSDGLPRLFDIDVPAGAGTLLLHLRAEGADTASELFLYDCTTGQCFSYDIGFPAGRSHRIAVRKPTAGRWVAAINTAPFPTSSASFVLDEVITVGTPVRRSSLVSRPTGARWKEVFGELPDSPEIPSGTPVILFELIDAAAERWEATRPWNPHPRFVKLRDRPVAIASAIYIR